jgi:fructose-1,6-bisphosphatase/inositol monophosphatase family enzyme
MDFKVLADIATKAALRAGEVIQNFDRTTLKVQQKKGGNTLASQVVTALDLECEKVIRTYLEPTCKALQLGILSEETEDNQSRFTNDYFWCVDPLDGTLAFINNHPGFSVSIALVSKDGTPYIGVVYDPSTHNLYTAIKGKGAFKNGQPWVVKPQNNFLTYVTDKTLADTPNHTLIQAILKAKATALGVAKIKEMSGGGAVLNAIWVAENSPALLVKLPKKEKGGGSLWDFAATACIFQELGLLASAYDQSALNVNPKTTTFLNTQGVYFSS